MWWLSYHVVTGNPVGARHHSRIPFIGVRKGGQAQINTLRLNLRHLRHFASLIRLLESTDGGFGLYIISAQVSIPARLHVIINLGQMKS